jgi:LysM repeat protein
MSSKATIKSGRILVIPTAQGNSSPAAKDRKAAVTKRSAKGATAGKQKQYLVKKGDTLFSLSQRFGISVDDLKKINKLSGTTLKAGTTIRVSR